MKSVQKVSSCFEYFKNLSLGLDVAWQIYVTCGSTRPCRKNRLSDMPQVRSRDDLIRGWFNTWNPEGILVHLLEGLHPKILDMCRLQSKEFDDWQCLNQTIRGFNGMSGKFPAISNFSNFRYSFTSLIATHYAHHTHNSVISLYNLDLATSVSFPRAKGRSRTVGEIKENATERINATTRHHFWRPFWKVRRAAVITA